VYVYRQHSLRALAVCVSPLGHEKLNTMPILGRAEAKECSPQPQAVGRGKVGQNALKGRKKSHGLLRHR